MTTDHKATIESFDELFMLWEAVPLLKASLALVVDRQQSPPLLNIIEYLNA